jgi:hypothetical protein
MTYCTLEEAWGTNFEKKKKKKIQKKNKEVEHFENKTTNEMNEDKSSQNDSPPESYLYDFSRSPYKLAEHNGNDDRIDIKNSYTIDNSHLDENEEIEEDVKEKLHIVSNKDNHEDEGDTLIDRINELLTKFEYNQGNTTQEVVLFALIGIFIIFVLDTFVKIGKMYN